MAGSTRQGASPRGGGGEDRTAGALTGGGPSLLGVDGSMRARDVSRPTEADYAEAERLVQVSYRPRSQTRPPLPPLATRAATPAADATRQPEGTGGSSPDTS